MKNPALSWVTKTHPAGHIDEWIGKINNEEVYSVCLVHAENDYFRLYDISEGEKEMGLYNTLGKAVNAATRHSLGIDEAR